MFYKEDDPSCPTIPVYLRKNGGTSPKVGTFFVGITAKIEVY